MEYQNGHVMTLANSIIGVSILAMPYCFKQCGIILSILILLVSSIISRLACHFLLKSAIIARRKTFEFLAFHIFGALGKFAIEIGMIGFLLGTCIAFFVVMGDLGPEIISEMTEVKTGSTMRTTILIALAVFVVVPLGLLHNVDSLNGVSKATIGFYCCLVLKIIIEALPHIFTGDWVYKVDFWRPAGILQCLPIFSMALFCQTQLFEIYQAIPNPSLDKMNSLIRVAVNICTWAYIFVGAFGYIAFFQTPFTGNILLSFRPSIMTDVMKIGFILSLAFSFPLVIFPCRASLYSLLYKEASYTSIHESNTTNYIPEGKFKLLTLLIVAASLTVGILIPTIELVLGLVGSTIGVMICVLFPVTCFICISPKNTNERILAQIMLFVGVIVMVLGTYANLYAFEEAKFNMVTDKPAIDININEPPGILNPPKIDNERNVMDIPTTVKALKLEELEAKVQNDVKVESLEGVKEVRHEPPQPVEVEEPVEVKASPKPPDVKAVERVEEKEEVKEVVKEDVKDKQEPVIEPVQPEEDVVKEKEVEKPKEAPKAQLVNEVDVKEAKPTIPSKVDLQPAPAVIKESEDKKEKVEKKEDEVDIEAIKKEEVELKAREKEEDKEKAERDRLLIESINKQNQVQEKIVEQQKKIIEAIESKHGNLKDQNALLDEEKLKAVKNIENIAKQAIESISGQGKKNVVEDKEAQAKKIAAPLSYQLGLNQEQNKNIVETNADLLAKAADLLPLPMALAKLNQALNITAEKEQQPKDEEHPKKEKADENKVVEPAKIERSDDVIKNDNSVEAKIEKPKEEETVKKEEENVKKEEEKVKKEEEKVKKEENEEDAKAMRRDILSDSEKLERAKRDVSAEDAAVSIQKVCEEIGKSTTTEHSVIKHLCKLSEPNLMRVDLAGLDNVQGDVMMKPQKRDLKEARDV